MSNNLKMSEFLSIYLPNASPGMHYTLTDTDNEYDFLVVNKRKIGSPAPASTTFRNQLIEWLVSEPEKFSKFLVDVMADARSCECQFGDCSEIKCTHCVLCALEKPIF